MGLIQAMYMLAILSNLHNQMTKVEQREEEIRNNTKEKKTVINTEDLNEKTTDLHEIHGFTEIRQDIKKY